MRALVAAALVAAAVVSPAKAYDQWNGSGFSMNHHYYGMNITGTAPGPQIIVIPYEDEVAARQKAIADQRICAPVVLWTDEGRIVHPAMGCRR
jgi:hypothetical protein